jgi:hypothetical protein
MNIRTAIDRVEAERGKPNAYAFLPEIHATLQAMMEAENDSRGKREQLARGLEKYVLENYEFSESSLGGYLLELSDAFVKGDG